MKRSLEAAGLGLLAAGAVLAGGHIFIHNDGHGLTEIAAFLTSSTAPMAYVNREPEVGAQRSDGE